jgi:hypothetical protein
MTNLKPGGLRSRSHPENISKLKGAPVMNNKILGIIGSALLIIGIFLPILSFMGIISFSLFTFIQGLPTGAEAMPDETGILSLFRIIGIVILLLGIGSLLLALKNQFKALIATGLVSLCILVFIFIKLQSFFSQIAEKTPPEAREMLGAISTGWGLYVMILGAIAVIVAGVMKSPAATINPGWGAPPPPYPPAR